MNTLGVCSVLATLLFMTTVKAEGGVSFWRSQFTMTCPKPGEWYKSKGKDMVMVNVTNDNPTGEKLTRKYDDTWKGHYYCKYLLPQSDVDYSDGSQAAEPTQYHFYVKGKACESCFELNGNTVCVAIVADLLLTGGVILLVYVKAKKREPAPTKPSPRAGGGRGGPPVPSPDYEALNPNTRNADPYSTVHRMG